MKKTLSLIMAGLLTVAMAVTASAAGNSPEADRGNIKFGVKGIAETVEWTADGEWTEGEYAEIEWKRSWISAAWNLDDEAEQCQNLDFKLGMSWDADYLYTYVEFEDPNGHENAMDDNLGNIWQPGAIQMNVAEVDSEGDQRLEYGVALSSVTGNKLSNVWADYMGSGYAVPESDYEVVVDGDTVIYEIRTPFETFSAVDAKEGAQYGYCLVISWGNGTDHAHTQLAAGCTGDAGKAAQYFADITLEEAIVVETEPETVVEEVVADAAPATFDAGIVAAVAAIVSAAGYALSKKH
jgi:hypothetical protein